MLTVLLVAGLVACAYLLLSKAVAAPRMRIDRSLGLIEAYGFAPDEPADPTPERESLASKLGGRLIGRVGSAQLLEQRKLLISAGMYRVTPEQFLGFRVFGAVGVPILLAQFALSAVALPLGIGMIVLGGLTGWTLPNTIVARRAASRLTLIDRGMPELVDLLVVGVESGMGFNGAIRASVDRIDGPLAEELRLMLQEQQLGASMSDALGHVAVRADTPAVRAFVRTIAQADKLGISIGQMMRTLADEMRKRRRAQAEERAQKAPVKILFPLVFLIFPSIFIVLLTPAAINIVTTLG